MSQAQENSKVTDVPVAVIKMNKFQPLAIVDATHFLKLIGIKEQLKKILQLSNEKKQITTISSNELAEKGFQ